MIKLEICNSTSIVQYEPGDHVAIYPHHTDSEVNFVMEHLTKKPTNQDTLVELYEYIQNGGRSKIT